MHCISNLTSYERLQGQLGVHIIHPCPPCAFIKGTSRAAVKGIHGLMLPIHAAFVLFMSNRAGRIRVVFVSDELPTTSEPDQALALGSFEHDLRHPEYDTRTSRLGCEYDTEYDSNTTNTMRTRHEYDYDTITARRRHDYNANLATTGLRHEHDQNTMRMRRAYDANRKRIRHEFDTNTTRFEHEYYNNRTCIR